jgi:peptidoglycan/LPS O-acetylase OafA/YrhL
MRPTADATAGVSPYIPALDGIRALAILLVIPHNVDVLTGSYPAALFPFVALTHAGWIGVQLFFVLSGFLITGNLLDTRGTRNYYSAFITRRALRILPLYFGVLLVALVLLPLHDQVWLWTFLSNWTAPFGHTVTGFSHFWSLAVEEQFYLLWPMVVACCRPTHLLKVCGALVAAALLTRLLLMSTHASDDALYMFTPARMDALALGAAAAAAVRIATLRERLTKARAGLAAAALGTLLLDAILTRGYVFYDHNAQSYGYTLLALGFALVVLVLALPTSGLIAATARVLAWPPLRLIARYSYGMYVFHLPLHVYFTHTLLHGPPTAPVAIAYSALVVVLSFLLAAASYELYERRFLNLKARVMPKPAVA